MMTFQWPWLGVLLPLPYILRWLLPAQAQADQAALIVPFLNDFPNEESRTVSAQQRWPILVATFAWIWYLLALDRNG